MCESVDFDYGEELCAYCGASLIECVCGTREYFENQEKP